MAFYIDPPLNDPPVQFDAQTRIPRWSNAWFQFFQKLEQSGQQTGELGEILTVDPSPLVNDTWWIFRDGGTPETVFLKVRIGGVTTAFPIGTT